MSQSNSTRGSYLPEADGREAIPLSARKIFPGIRGRLVGGFHWLSHWVSLPLAIWLCSGWIGLIGHLQGVCEVAGLLESTRIGIQSGLRAMVAGVEISKGEASCGLVENEAN